MTAPQPPLTPQGAVAGSPGALERLESRFRLIKSRARISGRELIIPELADPLSYIRERVESGSTGPQDLPYWTKVWPAALVLAGFAAAHKGEGPLLELGAGMGLPGLAAALGGRKVVLTDLDADALEFARAAVELNQLEDRVEVRYLDWENLPDDLQPCPTILGAEILYHPPLYPLVARMMDQLLVPGGTAFISHEERPFAIKFFTMLPENFTLRSTSQTVGGGEDDEPTKVFLHALRKAA